MSLTNDDCDCIAKGFTLNMFAQREPLVGDFHNICLPEHLFYSFAVSFYCLFININYIQNLKHVSQFSSNKSVHLEFHFKSVNRCFILIWSGETTCFKSSEVSPDKIWCHQFVTSTTPVCKFKKKIIAAIKKIGKHMYDICCY